MPVNVLSICTGSNHKLTYWAYCSGISCWLAQLGCVFTHETCSAADFKVPQHLEKRFHHKCQSTFWPFLLDQTMNRDFLGPVQWHRALTVSTWTPFHMGDALPQIRSQSNFNRTGPGCHGNEIWYKTGYNSARMENIVVPLAPSRGYSIRGWAIEWCQTNSTTTNSRCHGNEI